ncbi:MAG: micrococcal nuclease [Solirubrobacteraceae bacterium]|nr:micrococcal nuclease [Solirubrobacteraceae bacterium]
MTAGVKPRCALDAIRSRVTFKGDPAQGLPDRFGRLLAYVSAGGVDYGRTMISSGCAKVLVVGQGFERAPSYRRAQALAKAARRGVWRTCGGHFHRPR